MNKIKPASRFAGISAALVLAASVALAPVAFAKDHGARMAEKLEIQESQTAAFNQAMASSGEDMKALREQMKSQMDTILAARRVELSAVLDSEQLAEYDEMMEKRQSKMHKRHGKKDHDCKKK
ncbi:hypothetical protein [Allohahella marinimesophila]|uniref:Zinc resistance-associated protein n=1 Tax=Allohahella marinimesophila TaxID=1054972 RepID=A0ABP7Q3R6_9GAMM